MNVKQTHHVKFTTTSTTFSDCISLQDPHCAWDYHNAACENVDNITSRLSFVQDIKHGDVERCRIPPNGNIHLSFSTRSTHTGRIAGNKKIPMYKNDIVNKIIANTVSEDGSSDFDGKIDEGKGDCGNGDIDSNEIPTGCAIQQKLVIPRTLHIVLFIACSLCLVFGFVAGYFISKRFQPQPQYPNSPFIEQHNHLDR